MGDEGTGAGVRGVSGGERKRVTVGIGLVTQPKVPLSSLCSLLHACQCAESGEISITHRD